MLSKGMDQSYSHNHQSNVILPVLHLLQIWRKVSDLCANALRTRQKFGKVGIVWLLADVCETPTGSDLVILVLKSGHQFCYLDMRASVGFRGSYTSCVAPRAVVLTLFVLTCRSVPVVTAR